MTTNQPSTKSSPSMPLPFQPPPILHQIIQLLLRLPLIGPLLHRHPRRQNLHLQLPSRRHRLLQILGVVLTTRTLEDLLHAGGVQLAADVVADVFGHGRDGFGEGVGEGRGGERADRVIVAHFADGELGNGRREVPVAANEDVFARAFADDGFFLVEPDEVGHGGFFAGAGGFLGGFLAFVNVLGEADRVEAEGAGARGRVDLVAFVAEEGAFEGGQDGFDAVHAVRADLEVGEVVVFGGVFVFDSVPVPFCWFGTWARVVVIADVGEFGEVGDVGLFGGYAADSGHANPRVVHLTMRLFTRLAY